MSLDDWTPPPEFDGFTLIRPLGAGGMGAVFLAREAALERLVAIKVIATQSPDALTRERFQREGKSLARLSHPNVVAIYRVGEIRGRPYLAYEYVEGTRVDELERPTEWRVVLGIGLSLARGLAAAHQAGVLHRDVKPTNAIVTANGDTKLIDFGVARPIEPAALASPAPLWPVDLDDAEERSTAVLTADPLGGGGERLTGAGGLLGTPLYLAPELWLGAPATERSDVYALGVMLHELLAGDLPELRLHGVERVNALKSRALPRLAAVVGGPLAEVIEHAVLRDPERRPSASELRDRLEEMAALFRPFSASSSDEADRRVGAVRASFERVVVAHEDFADRFYQQMFARAPALRRLFRGDLAQQQRMITATLRLAIENLNAPERLAAVLEELGRRHASYGVQASDLEVMGQAIVATLAALDPAWTAEIARAWAEAYDHIARWLLRGMRLGSSPASVASVVTPSAEAPGPAARHGYAVRWLERPGGELAHRTVGRGERRLVLVGEWLTHVGAFEHHGRAAALVQRLVGLGALLLHDARGTGLSTRALPTCDAAAADLAALLAATGEAPVSLIAVGSGFATAARAARLAPERVRGLVGLGAGVRGLGLGPMSLADLEAAVRRGWGSPLLHDVLAPSLADDASHRRFLAELAALAASPSEAIAMLRRIAADDAGAAATALRCPVTLIARRGDRARPATESAELAATIPGAQLVLLDGDDHLPWAGDLDAMVAAIRGALPVG